MIRNAFFFNVSNSYASAPAITINDNELFSRAVEHDVACPYS